MKCVELNMNDKRDDSLVSSLYKIGLDFIWLFIKLLLPVNKRFHGLAF